MDSSLERMEDLLVKRSLEGLGDVEARELVQLRSRFPQVDVAAFDRAVAAISLAGLPAVEQMPAGLYAQIEATGVQIAAEYKASASRRKQLRSDGRAGTRPVEARRARRREHRGVVPWLVAAASLVAAVIAWWPRTEPQTALDLAARRQLLISTGARLERWTPAEDITAAGASGDVVWSSAMQEGYLRLVLLSANDPGEFQYQLWIFDAERDDRYPVDGGVFDIPSGADEIIVPVRAGLPVGEVTMFAITVERPGGVVVSDRERIALLADFG